MFLNKACKMFMNFGKFFKKMDELGKKSPIFSQSEI